MAERPTVIGISGGSGSGKSWLAQRVVEAFPDDAILVEQDWYYRDQSRLTPKAAENYNFDHPSAIEHTLLVQHLRTLDQGKEVAAPGYCYSSHRRLEAMHHLQPKPIILVEGLFALYWPELRKCFSYKLYIKAIPEVRLERRLHRDSTERGYTENQILAGWNRYALPMHDQFVKPTAQFADFVWDSSEDTSFETKFLADLRGRLAKNGKNPK